MRRTEGIRRAQFLAGMVSAGLAAAVLPAGPARVAHRGLRHHGVVYTVGAGETPGTAFRTARMREDIRVWATSCTPTPST